MNPDKLLIYNNPEKILEEVFKSFTEEVKSRRISKIMIERGESSYSTMDEPFDCSQLVIDSLLEIKIGTLVRLPNGIIGEVVSTPKIKAIRGILKHNLLLCYTPLYKWNYGIIFKDPKFNKMRFQVHNFINLLGNKAKYRQQKLRILKHKINE